MITKIVIFIEIFLFQVLLTFYEKEVPFKPWYVKLNPGVHVPVLQDDETVITEPDKIIKYIDSSFPAGKCFVFNKIVITCICYSYFPLHFISI